MKNDQRSIVPLCEIRSWCSDVTVGDELQLHHTFRTVITVMGGSVSTKCKDKASMDIMVGLILPVYYTKAAITSSELAILKETWKLVEKDQSQFFFEFQNQLKRVGVCPPRTCSEYLFNSWTQRLLDIKPDVKLMLNKIDTEKLEAQLPSTMTLLIDCVVDNPLMFESIVQGLVASLRALNIRSCESKLNCYLLLLCIVISLPFL